MKQQWLALCSRSFTVLLQFYIVHIFQVLTVSLAVLHNLDHVSDLALSHCLITIMNAFRLSPVRELNAEMSTPLFLFSLSMQFFKLWHSVQTYNGLSCLPTSLTFVNDASGRSQPHLLSAMFSDVQ